MPKRPERRAASAGPTAVGPAERRRAGRRRSAHRRQHAGRTPGPGLPRPAVLAVVGLLAAAAMGVLGFRWLGAIPLRETRIAGTEQADHDTLLKLAAVDSVRTLFEVDPALTADRLRRHPWVKSVRVSRRPSGTLLIRVHERTPMLLVSTGGRPVAYLDAEGHRLPLGPGQHFDVPVVHATLPKGHATRPVDDPPLLQFAAALAAATPETRSLLSEAVVTDAGIRVFTMPSPDGHSVPVELGTDRFGERLHVLEAFWREEVTAGRVSDIHHIDLRFEGQVIIS